MDASAVRTLRTRAFFHQFPRGEAPESYYAYAAGKGDFPWTDATKLQWDAAQREVIQVELGNKRDDALLDARIADVAEQAKQNGTPWVLVGGPPCQAFSLAGRARNLGNEGYIPEHDERHFLYRHYLRLLSRYRPAAFVLENVRGMLSSRIWGELLFDDIFRQLQRPGGPKGPRYRIEPLVVPEVPGLVWEASDFLVFGEALGLPQTRHRVILIGVLDPEFPRIKPLTPSDASATVADMIGGLPPLRSSLTDATPRDWPTFASKLLAKTAKAAAKTDAATSELLADLAERAVSSPDAGTGGRWVPGKPSTPLPAHLKPLMHDPRLKGVLQHFTRGQMQSDLMRYGFAAAYASKHGRSPRGAAEFPVALHPNHESWKKSSHFVDRFKVQRAEAPSSTITSHLAKDGHYFIHPDPAQLRSLSVREAARLQTFPDNYLFEGPAVSQRKQVGNAVPPYLAQQIASVIHEALA
ncbi:DNA cytosine methyltransferase [Lysobacter claricitrinus]|uniref:DNA cytosine methyltransferase n=1 Tax=Lysobacter claricitrinus TaxID=3367728 RepID=UPI0038B26346